MNRLELLLELLESNDDPGKYTSIAKGKYQIPRTLKNIVKTGKRLKHEKKLKKNG